MENNTMENTRYKILLVEDDKLDQIAFIRMTEDRQLPYDCTVVSSVSQATEALACQDFDVVISDYALGDGTALSVLDAVKNAPLILVTGVGDEEIAVTAWRAGVYDYLVKDSQRSYLKAVPITVENAVNHERMENKLQLLSHAIVGTEDSVYIADMDNKITFVNRAFCETYGYTEEQVIGKNCNILWKEADSQDTFQAVGGWEVGFYHKRKDGSEFPVSLSSSPIEDKNGKETAVVFIARDISERMRIESRLRRLNHQLEEQNRLKSELAVSFAQDLTESLRALDDVINEAAAVAQGSEQNDLFRPLQSARKEIERLLRTVSNFYDSTKIEADKTEVKVADAAFE